jgi:uncharacterized protein (DUF2132 family)
MNQAPSKDPLHGKTLAAILEDLRLKYTWEELAALIPINCFRSNPSMKSSLTFLRKTPWARAQVEQLYLSSLVRPNKHPRELRKPRH